MDTAECARDVDRNPATPTETEAFRTEFLRELAARGLTGVRLVISDAAIMRLVGALIVEHNEEWHLTRRYMSNESPAKAMQQDPENKLLETREVA